MKERIIVPLAVAFLIAAFPADETDQLKRGVELYNSGKFAEALEAFLKAEEADPKAPLPKYNAMAVMAETEKLNEMERKLTADFSTLGSQEDIRAKSAYNLGTAYLKLVDAADKAGQLPSKAKELDSAVNWLRRSLLDDSIDSEAKNNLEYANKLKKKLEKQKQDQQGDGKNKDQQDQQDKQDKQDQKQDQQDQKQQKDQDRKQDQQQQNQQERKEQQEREISDDMARNLLEAARDAEKKAIKMLREQLKKKAGKKPRKEKDW